MNNNVVTFDNNNLNLKVRAILNVDGSISINAEDTAIGFGWTEQKNNKEYVRWRTINNYLNELGFSQVVAKDDYIPESLFYMLGMKANNAIALEFQKWLAIDVLPSIRQTGTYSTKQQQGHINQQAPVPFSEITKSIIMFTEALHMNDGAKALAYSNLCKDYGIPTSFLPSYVNLGGKETQSATYCLKKIGSNLSATAFNKLLLSNGYLEERQRQSTSSSSGVKSYKALTDKGLQYGLNLTNPNNQKEVQPHYYVDTFKELYDIVTKEDEEEIL